MQKGECAVEAIVQSGVQIGPEAHQAGNALEKLDEAAIRQYRQETPGCDHVVHLNNAGAALMPRSVYQALSEYLQYEVNYGGYEAADYYTEGLTHTYDAVARLIHCRPEEVAILESATRAWTMAFYGLRFEPGDKILTSVSEYASNVIAFQQQAKRLGAEVHVIPNDVHGQINVDALAAMMDERVRLVAITHIPTNGGLVNPADAIGKVVQQYPRCLYLLDACQSAGQLPLDVQKIGCHMLSATSRKYLRGPRGVGFLYVAQAVMDELEPPLLDLHSAEWQSESRYTLQPNATRFESWETNFAGKLAMGTAIDYALSIGIDAIWQRLQGLSTTLRQQLAELPTVTVQDLGAVKSGLVSFTLNYIPPEQYPQVVKQLRQQHQINISYSPKVYTPHDMSQRNLSGILRASVHYYNTIEDLTHFVNCLSSFKLQ